MIYQRSVWRNADLNIFIPRCGLCGKYFKEEGMLKEHWFFKGVYCVGCIQDRLYDNARIMEEIK